MIRRSSRFLCLLVLVGTGVAAAQVPPADAIPNWPAPPFWEPPSARSLDAKEDAGLSPQGVPGEGASSALPFIGIRPCRIADTRGNGFTGQAGPPALTANQIRTFQVGGGTPGVPIPCGISPFAQAVSVQLTIIQPTGAGNLVAWPIGDPPTTSVLNWPAGIFALGNGTVVQMPTGATFKVLVNAAFGVTAHLTIDVNGYYAGASTPTAINTFLGSFAGNPAMTGAGNTAIGTLALNSNDSGDSNTAVGHAALMDNNMATGNTAVGNSALANVNGAGAHFNIGIGNNGGAALTTGSENIAIGSFGVAGESLTIRIGQSQTATYIQGIHGRTSSGGTAVFVKTDGKLGTSTSSRRFKEDIREIGDGSDGLMRLRPVAFRYKPETDPGGLTQYGLIAEEVAEVYPELVVTDRQGRPEAVRYHLIEPLLLNELQNQRRTIERQQDEIDGLREELRRLESRLGTRPDGNSKVRSGD